MKRKLLFATVTVVFSAALLATPPAAQASTCTNANVAGSYGYTSTGTVVTPPVGPFAAVGRVTFDASGTLSGTQRSSFAGTQFDENVSGTFSVNEDCTGSATVNVFHGTTLVRTTGLNLVWDANRTDVRAIFLSAGTVITIEASKIAPAAGE